MRRLSVLATAGLFALPLVAQAKPLSELLAEKNVGNQPSPAKVYYQDGTRLEFPDAGFDMKMNLRLQSIFTYEDLDGGQDSNDFSVRNARVEFEGHLLNKQFSYKLSNDFDTGMDDNTGLQDAWLEWNPCEDSGVRMGQFKTNFGRQWMVSNSKYQFIDESIATQAFTFGRQGGAMYHGPVGDFGWHGLAVFNGESSYDYADEGQNVPGLDTEVMGVYNIAFDLIGGYDRSYEGDPYNTADFSLGMGAAVYYGNAKLESGEFSNKTENYGANVDVGFRGMGWSGQAEFLWNRYDLDDEIVFAGNTRDQFDGFGMYGQLGYFFVPQEWEVAARFSWVDIDKDGQAIGLTGDSYEYGAVLGYYLWGHNLKVLTGPTWVVLKDSDVDGGDLTDFRYQVGLFGWF